MATIELKIAFFRRGEKPNSWEGFEGQKYNLESGVVFYKAMKDLSVKYNTKMMTEKHPELVIPDGTRPIEVGADTTSGRSIVPLKFKDDSVKKMTVEALVNNFNTELTKCQYGNVKCFKVYFG